MQVADTGKLYIWKINLIEKDNPDWENLYGKIV
ncbi:hypothetical protein Wcon_01344 [Wolbachia endosymbiont of Cylisticus convexus]|nr:hypothetical protein Wcon_01344 [Wolbachia endosymbiont of Cylisticus convexus]